MTEGPEGDQSSKAEKTGQRVTGRLGLHAGE